MSGSGRGSAGWSRTASTSTVSSSTDRERDPPEGRDIRVASQGHLEITAQQSDHTPRN
jgi:hypothetical protein